MSDEQTVTPSPTPDNSPALLFIDDEANILSALKRLFRPLGYRIFTAANGEEGLALLEHQAVDVVLSDMRMPGMDGDEVLKQVRLKYPDTIRILLTGYADVNATIAAINRGEIYRYIAKPWIDTEIVLDVQQALERKQLQAERQRLEALTRGQNEELKALNANLEEKVRGRSEVLRKAMTLLQEEKLRLEELVRTHDEELKALSARLAEQEHGRTDALQKTIAELQAENRRLEGLSRTHDEALKAHSAHLEEQEHSRTGELYKTITALQADKLRLEELIRHQNEELDALNASLEIKVIQGTEALRQTMVSLDGVPEIATFDLPDSPLTLLFIDDETNILSALKRLFRPHGYRILTADSGPAGLALLEREHVDLVVSDMRMPGMSGAEVLEQTRLKFPDTMRILLTGYADIGSTVAAINRGEIYRYISKPWNDDEIVLTVKQALERKQLQAEKLRLEELTRSQNEELKNLNASLEDKVRARTEALKELVTSLEEAHEKLKKNFMTSIKVFANLMEMREGSMTGHSRRVADLARDLAKNLELPSAEIQDVVVAALLHDIGKIGLPDQLLTKPFSHMNAEERSRFIEHPTKGAAALMALEQLAVAADLIRYHHERHDGKGYPGKLSGEKIPLGARILALANDYDALQSGRLVPRKLSKTEAFSQIVDGRGTRYDPQVVDAFIELNFEQPELVDFGPEIQVSSKQLRVGMVLSRDVVARDGLLLLARDYVLDETMIEQLRNFERTDGFPLMIRVRPPAKADGLPAQNKPTNP